MVQERQRDEFAKRAATSGGMQQDFTRVPPQNLEAEMSVLGAMLINKDAISEVVPVLRATDFYRPQHATIFDAIIKIFGEGGVADAITISAALKKDGELERCGGQDYLYRLVSMVPTAANVVHYAKIVQDTAKLRALINAGTKIVQLAQGGDGLDVDAVIDLAQQEMFAVAEQHIVNDYADFEHIIPDVIKEIEINNARDGEMAGLPTGFYDLDASLNGLRAGQMIIAAARPGYGKSTLAMDICRNVAIKERKAVAFFSLEMSRTELVMRALAAESGVFLNKLIRGDLEQRDWNTIASTLERIGQSPFYVDDSPNLTMTEIRAKARRLRQQNQIELIVIDYLQLLTSGGRTPESRQQEVSEFSRSIKLLAKELGIPIIAVAQLNRNPEARNDKRPQVADLRESGSLEQDADVILLIHNKESEDQMDQPPSEIIVGKNRSGPTGSVELMFQRNRTRFANLAANDNFTNQDY
ncbi:replicative DNA helicase [Arcanobacterium hippocoleae]|uniref:replicative DNA helicase n=1 Tax=Arcanobacterium hippocoleae TaxID=149017 RepID=UPI0033417E37